jgi:hypothetical protein
LDIVERDKSRIQIGARRFVVENLVDAESLRRVSDALFANRPCTHAGATIGHLVISVARPFAARQ